MVRPCFLYLKHGARPDPRATLVLRRFGLGLVSRHAYWASSRSTRNRGWPRLSRPGLYETLIPFSIIVMIAALFRIEANLLTTIFQIDTNRRQLFFDKRTHAFLIRLGETGICVIHTDNRQWRGEIAVVHKVRAPLKSFVFLQCRLASFGQRFSQKALIFCQFFSFLTLLTRACRVLSLVNFHPLRNKAHNLQHQLELLPFSRLQTSGSHYQWLV